MPKCKCPMCGYEWEAKVDKPKCCPSCKSYKISRKPK